MSLILVETLLDSSPDFKEQRSWKKHPQNYPQKHQKISFLMFISKDTRGKKWFKQLSSHLTHLWRRSLLYRNKSIDLHSKSMDWFLYDRDLLNERVNSLEHYIQLAVWMGPWRIHSNAVAAAGPRVLFKGTLMQIWKYANIFVFIYVGA